MVKFDNGIERSLWLTVFKDTTITNGCTISQAGDIADQYVEEYRKREKPETLEKWRKENEN